MCGIHTSKMQDMYLHIQTLFIETTMPKDSDNDKRRLIKEPEDPQEYLEDSGKLYFKVFRKES